MSNNILWISVIWKAVSERLHLSKSVYQHQRTKFYGYKNRKKIPHTTIMLECNIKLKSAKE